jgi:hypothetical protein
MNTKELITRLRTAGGKLVDDGTQEVSIWTLMREAADALEQALKCSGALCEKRLVTGAATAPTPLVEPRVSLWLRREPEGHFTLLLEGPGRPCRAVGMVDADALGILHNSLLDVVENKAGNILYHALLATQEKKAGS